jgi:hypothetical protein
MLNTVTATRDPAPIASLAERDEFGPITGPTGLFTAPIEVASLAEVDELGRLLHGWAPDSDLL